MRRTEPQLHEAKVRHDAIAAALSRGHRDLKPIAAGKTQARWECGACGMEVDADWNPPANGIDVSGPAVALNCPGLDGNYRDASDEGENATTAN